MTWTVPEPTPPTTTYVCGEREMLESWLDFHRTTLLRKCAGLDGDQLVRRSVEPSSLSLLGLVRHLSEVERWWFRRNVAGEDLAELYCTPESEDGDFDDLDAAQAQADVERFLAECALARTAVLTRSLDDTFVHPRRGVEMSLRWVYVHMIEEYARHNGHADLLRERIDGRAGD
ncbi:MAG TPA: DinB family protein [Mycobacteriales bacterium]|nr:DinB family protein [Mycobacteriales bacterium]